jgi:hypothetical protein
VRVRDKGKRRFYVEALPIVLKKSLFGCDNHVGGNHTQVGRNVFETLRIAFAVDVQAQGSTVRTIDLVEVTKLN